MFAVLGAARPAPLQADRPVKVTKATRVEQARNAAVVARDLQAARLQAVRLVEVRNEADAALRAAEAQSALAAARLKAASAAAAESGSGLAADQVAIARLLPALLQIRRGPVLAVLAVPAPPMRAAFGATVLGGLVVALTQDAEALRLRQAEAARLAQTASADAASLARLREYSAARAAAARRDTAQAASQVTQAQAASLAVAAMDAAEAHARAGRPAAPSLPTGPAPAVSPGSLVIPVAGIVLRAFGAEAEDGPATGITYAAALKAVVVSPCAGRVAFAAPFRSYGQLVIVDCAGGSQTVLAGLGRLDLAPGRAVRAGAPVGRMPGPPGMPELYMELRSAGRPVDPLPFLRARL